MESNNQSLLLVANSGGHLTQLYSLKEFWGNYDRCWVTFKNEHSSMLEEAEEKVIYANEPVNRFVFRDKVLLNLLRNTRLAFKLLSSDQYDVIVTTGAGLGVLFVYAAKIFGVRSIFIDSLTRSKDLSFSAKLTKGIADISLSQWSSVSDKYNRLSYKGKVI